MPSLRKSSAKDAQGKPIDPSKLYVQEVVGDPWSFEPADIYITRDKFDQSEHHGRLVCAIFVDDPDFVEITVHPADGGRVRADPLPTPASIVPVVALERLSPFGSGSSL